jgi:O-glycosyl hydrolase
VRYFFQRVEQLNSYLMHLPFFYNSLQATAATSAVAPFDEAELLLRMCPEAWQNQYNLTQETVLQDLRKLLTVLENIEKCEMSSNVPMKPPASGTGTGKPNGNNEKNGKRKSTSSYADHIMKKVRTERHCVLCQKY